MNENRRKEGDNEERESDRQRKAYQTRNRLFHAVWVKKFTKIKISHSVRLSHSLADYVMIVCEVTVKNNSVQVSRRLLLQLTDNWDWMDLISSLRNLSEQQNSGDAPDAFEGHAPWIKN
jgi:hypothetical protein